MAQAGSAQREPSMEEILASIRRIIEDSDTTPLVAEDAAAPSQDNAEQDSAGSAEVHSFRDGLGAADEGLADEGLNSAQDQATQPSVHAIERAEQTDDAGSLHEGVAQSGGFDDAGDEPDLADSGELLVESAEEISRSQSEARSSVSEQTVMAESDISEKPEPALKPAPDPAIDNNAGQRPAIVSDFTGRKVAAAFDELSGAFEASRRKSFDDMAEEMLRPMLQDWLDNNLPGLVERLVREEIERVARGGSR